MGILDVTPMPTIMPIETSSGLIPSAEVQEELKAAVQSYMEVLYSALSMSGAEDFKQNSFGNLISETTRDTSLMALFPGKFHHSVE